jgi:hypothetical protein
MFTGIRLTTLLLGGFERITIQRGKIEYYIIFFYLNFIFHLLTNNSFLPYRLRDFGYEVQKKS